MTDLTDIVVKMKLSLPLTVEEERKRMIFGITRIDSVIYLSPPKESRMPLVDIQKNEYCGKGMLKMRELEREWLLEKAKEKPGKITYD